MLSFHSKPYQGLLAFNKRESFHASESERKRAKPTQMIEDPEILSQFELTTLRKREIRREKNQEREAVLVQFYQLMTLTNDGSRLND